MSGSSWRVRGSPRPRPDFDPACRGGFLIEMRARSGARPFFITTCANLACESDGADLCAYVVGLLEERFAHVPRVWHMPVDVRASPWDRTMTSRLRKRQNRAGAEQVVIHTPTHAHVFASDDLTGRRPPTTGRPLAPATALLLAEQLLPRSVKWPTGSRSWVPPQEPVKPRSRGRDADRQRSGNSYGAKTRRLAEQEFKHLTRAKFGTDWDPGQAPPAGIPADDVDALWDDALTTGKLRASGRMSRIR